MLSRAGQKNSLCHLMLVGRSSRSTSPSSPSTADTMALTNFLSAHRHAPTSQEDGLKEACRVTARHHAITPSDKLTEQRDDTNL